MILEMPMRTYSEMNTRGHWSVRARRAKSQRFESMVWVRSSFPVREILEARRITVKLTRVGPRELDSDNLAGSLKAVRDGIADALELDDGDKRLTWLYEQEQGAYAVRVEVLT